MCHMTHLCGCKVNAGLPGDKLECACVCVGGGVVCVSVCVFSEGGFAEMTR